MCGEHGVLELRMECEQKQAAASCCIEVHTLCHTLFRTDSHTRLLRAAALSTMESLSCFAMVICDVVLSI